MHITQVTNALKYFNNFERNTRDIFHARIKHAVLLPHILLIFRNSQNITKSRLTEKCCDGYVELKINNETYTCVPTCRGGCVQGYCSSPNICTCNLGFEGRHCSQSIPMFILKYYLYLYLFLFLFATR